MPKKAATPSAEPAEKNRGGRPTKFVDQALDTPVLIRLTRELRDKLRRLGGADWIRDRIRRAKDPAGPASPVKAAPRQRAHKRASGDRE